MKKHGGGTQSRETLTQINCKVRLARSRLDGGRVAAVRCVCLQKTAMMKKAEKDAVRSSSISVGRGNNDIIPPDCLQQRLSHSAEVGAFLPKLGRHSTKAVARRLPQHNEGATVDDAARATNTQPQSPTAAAMTKQNRGAQSTLSKSSGVTLFRMKDGGRHADRNVIFIPASDWNKTQDNSQAHNNAGKHTHTHTNRRGAVGARTRRRMRRPTEDTPSHSAHTAKQHPQKEGTRRKHSPRMEDEKRHSATASSSIPRPTGYGHSPQPTQSAHEVSSQRATRRSDSSSINDAATTFPAIPPTMEFDARLKAVIGGASRLQEK
ncbi:hypothetical protein TcCL_NonESM05170 [Trypanosoma cruzi]|nr:hypothetical protein TcCL_NonESM05170 [Trypanosoma cruzi]